MKVDVVLGIGNGEKYIGLVTDYLCCNATKPVATVKYSAGSIEGNTVEYVSGAKHTFRHVGAGTFAFSSTILTNFYVIDPVLVCSELEFYSPLLDTKLELIVDPEALIITPYDKIIHTQLEKRASTDELDKCTSGVRETIKRTELRYSLCVRDVIWGDIENALRKIKHEYFPIRLLELGLDKTLAPTDDEIAKFIMDSRTFVENVKVAYAKDAIKKFPNVVFESTRGLCSRQHSAHYSHAANINVGLSNVACLLQAFPVVDVTVYYVTHITNHGPNASALCATCLLDPSSVIMGYDKMYTDVVEDSKYFKRKCKVVSVVVCDDTIPFDNMVQLDTIVKNVSSAVGATDILVIDGNTRNHVHGYN